MSDPVVRFILRQMRGHGAERPFRHRLVGLIFRNWPGMITCARFEQFLLDYHEGELPEPQRRLFEGHLEVCGLCRSSYEGYRRAIELGQRLFADYADAPVPGDVPAELVAAVIEALKRRG